MSYQIVKTLRVVNFEDGTACVISGQSSNNVSPKSFEPQAFCFAENEAALRALMAYWQMGGSWQFPRSCALVKGYAEKDLTAEDASLVTTAKARWAGSPPALTQANAQEILDRVKETLASTDPKLDWERKLYAGSKELKQMEQLLAGVPVKELQAAERSASAKNRSVLETNIYELPEDHWLARQRGATHVVGTPQSKGSKGSVGVVLITDGATPDYLKDAMPDMPDEWQTTQRVQIKAGSSPLKQLGEMRQLTLAEVENWNPAVVKEAMLLKGRELNEGLHAALATSIGKSLPAYDWKAPAEGTPMVLWKTDRLPGADDAFIAGAATSYPASDGAERPVRLTAGEGRQFAHVAKDANVLYLTPEHAEKVKALVKEDVDANSFPLNHLLCQLAAMTGSEPKGWGGLSDEVTLGIGKEALAVKLSDDFEHFEVEVRDAQGRPRANFKNLDLSEVVPMALAQLERTADLLAVEKAQAREAKKQNAGR